MLRFRRYVFFSYSQNRNRSTRFLLFSSLGVRFQQPHLTFPVRKPLHRAPRAAQTRRRKGKPLFTDSPPPSSRSWLKIGFMGSSARLFGRQRSVHQILGGGFIADVVLWRRRDVTVGILLGLLAAWLVFDRSGYTLLSFVSNVLLLLISILFTWARAAAILNRPPPPIPDMHLTKEVMNEAAVLVHSHVNMALLAFHDLVLGKDLKLFYRVAISLWLISVIGSLTDFLTLFYTSLVIVCTIPVLYEKYEDCIDRNLKLAYVEMQMYKEIYVEHFHKVKNWILEKKKPD